MRDPEEERWYQKYPAFPGIQKCVELLHSSNVRGAWVDIICMELQSHAAESHEQLVAAFLTERDYGVKVILLSVLAEAGLPASISLFAHYLEASEDRLRYWAAVGLKKIGTKEARAALWHHENQAA